MKGTRFIAAATLALASSALSGALAAPAAMAVPYGCYEQLSSNRTSAYSVCNGGSGAHRIVIQCSYLYFPTSRFVYGPWQAARAVSQAGCKTSERVTYADTSVR